MGRAVRRGLDVLLGIDGVAEVLDSKSTNKSEKFVQLYELGLSVSEISRVTDSVYSFVWGVLEDRTDGSIRKASETGGYWKTKILELWAQGKTVGEISYELRRNYSYCWAVVDKFRKANAATKVKK